VLQGTRGKTISLYTNSHKPKYYETAGKPAWSWHIYQKTAGNASRTEEVVPHQVYRDFWFLCKGEQSASCDLDILVEFNGSITLLGYARLENELSDKLGVKVDLVSKTALKPRIGKHILSEVVEVWVARKWEGNGRLHSTGLTRLE
jgi:predicted nucleotidyltransferase